MKIQDLHVLPKFRDGWSYLYTEHCRIDQEDRAIALHDAGGRVPVPCANLALLLLGPGVAITHAAISTLADHGCLVAWVGEHAIRYYATGLGETRSAERLLHQARLWADPQTRLQVIRRLYQARFLEPLAPDLTLQQIRGMEGIRVRQTYTRAAQETGLPWSHRQYRRDDWGHADPVNRALSTANSCLYGLCHAAIVSAGFSPAIGFIHTGKMLSFVYDVADLYKTQATIPLAFQIAAQKPDDLERRVRLACRDAFATGHLLERIIPDILSALDCQATAAPRTAEDFDADAGAPGPLWDPEAGQVAGGLLHTPEQEPPPP